MNQLTKKINYKGEEVLPLRYLAMKLYPSVKWEKITSKQKMGFHSIEGSVQVNYSKEEKVYFEVYNGCFSYEHQGRTYPNQMEIFLLLLDMKVLEGKHCHQVGNFTICHENH